MDAAALLERYYGALNRRDPAGLAEFVAPDIVFDDDVLHRQIVRGADAFAAALAGFWQAVPDLTFTIIDGPFLAETGSRCMVHVRLTGTLAAAVPDWGWTKVGGSADMEFMAVYTFRDDRVAHIRVCCNPAVLAGQLSA